MATNSEKFIFSVITAVILLLAVGLELGGSFVPRWARPINGTSEENGGNTSFSIWTKRECWNHMCKTTLIEVTWTLEECTTVDGRKGDCYTKTGVKKKPKTECWNVHYCNITWHHEEGGTSEYR
ncbi:hypothetical protein LOTGIDRAFT_156187 [Lottia gigantea]|uniref:Uncharacterized protein n=1 Tax=Lottia gigantea TaxID=225164 RepID=V4AL73_LOTGI|nr:hypothetical protein LOTGIDRAFT_156187 [Lottia gigantea]ESP04944.1 hypothetical protein LOTGIDRAFT_156187 [Lottia gigantea]